MAKKKAIKQLAGAIAPLQPKKSVMRPMPMPINPKTTGPSRAIKSYKKSHDTWVERNVMNATDKKRVASALGEDWKQKVYGDVGKYREARQNVRQTRQKVSGLNKQESSLEAEKGTPGAVDQALENRIQALQQREEKVKKSGRADLKAARAGKRSFQRAAQKTYVAKQTKNQTLAQKAGAEVSSKLKGRMGNAIYRNPNSQARIFARKQEAQKLLRKNAKRVAAKYTPVVKK